MKITPAKLSVVDAIQDELERLQVIRDCIEHDVVSEVSGHTRRTTCCLTNRASAAGARHAGAPCARSFYASPRAHKRNSSLLGRARQLQALVRQPLAICPF